MSLLKSWLSLYGTKAEALRDLNKSCDSNFTSSRLYDWLNPDVSRNPPEYVKAYMRKLVFPFILKDEGIILRPCLYDRIIDKLS